MEGDRVQVTLMFRGREMQHLSQGGLILNDIARELEDVAKIEHSTNRDGRRMFISLMPKPGLKPLPKKTAPGGEGAEEDKGDGEGRMQEPEPDLDDENEDEDEDLSDDDDLDETGPDE